MTEPTETISLRDHLTTVIRDADARYSERFAAQNEAVRAAMTASEKAVLKAEAASEKRFDGVNEFRTALNDMVTTLMPRAESEKRFEAVNQFFSTLNESVSALMPRGESDQRFMALSDKLDELRQRVDKHEAAGGGLKAGWGYLAALVALFVSILTVVTKV